MLYITETKTVHYNNLKIKTIPNHTIIQCSIIYIDFEYRMYTINIIYVNGYALYTIQFSFARRKNTNSDDLRFSIIIKLCCQCPKYNLYMMPII